MSATSRPMPRSVATTASIEACGYSVVCLLPEKRSSSLLTISRGPFASSLRPALRPNYAYREPPTPRDRPSRRAPAFRGPPQSAGWQNPNRAGGSPRQPWLGQRASVPREIRRRRAAGAAGQFVSSVPTGSAFENPDAVRHQSQMAAVNNAVGSGGIRAPLADEPLLARERLETDQTDHGAGDAVRRYHLRLNRSRGQPSKLRDVTITLR